MRDYHSLDYSGRYRYFAPAIALVVALYFAGTGLFRLPISSCEIDSSQPTFLYSQIILLWQTLFGPSIESGRLFSILVSVLTLALLYKLVSKLYGQRRALGIVCLAVAIPSLTLVFTWNTVYGWLAFLTIAATLCTYYAVQQPRLVILLYAIGIVLVVSGLWVVFFVDLLFILISNPKSRWYAVPGLLIIIGWLGLSSPVTASRASLQDLLQPVHTLFLIAWVIGIASIFPSILNRDSENSTFKVSLWIVIGLTMPVLAWILFPFDPGLLIIAVMAFLLMAFANAITLFSGRAQFATAALLLFSVFMQIVPTGDLTIVHNIQSLKTDQAAIAVGLPGRCLQDNELVTQLYEARLLPIYLHRNDGPWLEIAADRTPTQLNQPPTAAQYEWVIQPPDSGDVPAPANGLLAYQLDSPQGHTSLYYTGQHEAVTADHEVFYQVAELGLLKFDVQPSVQVHPGDLLIVDSWWAAKTAAQDNYILTLNLDDKSGQAITFASGQVAESSTEQWQPNQVYYDQRVLVVPESTSPGQYNLVMTVHGNFNVGNVHFKHSDGTDVGEYGYLTTITVLPAD